MEDGKNRAQNFGGSSQNLLGAEKQRWVLLDLNITVVVKRQAASPTLRCPHTRYTSRRISIAVLAFKWPQINLPFLPTNHLSRVTVSADALEFGIFILKSKHIALLL